MTRPDILIAGGDTRQLYCAARLADEYSVGILGFDDDYIPEELSLPATDTDCEGCCRCAVLPVPALDDMGNISAPCFSGTVRAKTVEKLLAPDGIVLAGKVDARLKAAFPRHEVCDYLLREELSLKNAVPTAEGAIQLALEELPVTLSGLPVLIVGLGRIGTALAGILKGFGANVTAAVYDPRGAAKAKLHGIASVPTRRMSGNYGLVFNTVPKLIFDREMLSRFDRKTLFIDLASKPGGIDMDAAAELGLRTVWALGLPGKTAPVTAGEIVAETAATILAERSGTDE
ncbi:dipicolinate synthase subunit DpsA [Ruminococcus sp.]|uniref:dipicolinate synthase subunit DpsA n=1 Tax=Ruminococcus sp. TaxID=41978 RepID=UPI002B8072EE|nr:dipicolinate synthase subunit DpsA [Ruminococcus sp.]HOA00580.1 dipicolinate synthase subunit DpsA [Ruminococcus sp.]HOH87982.1 dipicolinate synthase subunit DpsA [Ruminococcus sp.]